MVDNIEPAASIAAAVGPVGDRRGGHGRQPPADSGDKKRPVLDVALVLGMPADAVPAPAQDAILSLVEEVERLRDEVTQARQHEALVAAEADHHPLLPVLNRRAFIRSLARLLEVSERADLPGSLATLHISGIEELRQAHGLAAGDAALLHVARHILSDLRQTDLVGYLDGSDFAVALAVATEDGAEAKIRQITGQLAQQPFVWAEEVVPLTVGLGTVRFRAGLTAEQALACADAARRTSLMQ